MIHFPLYPLRGYELLFEDSGYKVIQTPKTRWVLDSLNLSGDYLSRRTKMLGMELPYRLYPLRNGVNSIAELIQNKKAIKTYIDRNGKLIKWTPTKMHKAISKKLTAKWIPVGIPKLCFALEGSSEIFSIDAPNYPANYARIVEIGNRRILFDVTEERMPDTRIKL